MRKRLVYIISDINKSLAFEWLFNDLKREFDVSVILLNQRESPMEEFLNKINIPVVNVRHQGKKDLISSISKVFSLLREWKPQVVHCHLIQANIVGLTAAWLARIPNRIYTRHHSSEHHIFFKNGVIWDKYCNILATKIIAISPAVEDILHSWEKVNISKTVLIPNGVKLEEFKGISEQRVSYIKEKYGLHDHFPVVGVISRFVEWKGVQYIIPAFKKLLISRPHAVLLLLNAVGDYKVQVLKLLSDVPQESYRLIIFEEDIPAVYKCMDVFVHVPYTNHSEAFGQIYVEALAARTPSVFTLSGIAPTFIKHRYNAMVVDFNSSDNIYQAIEDILNDHELRSAIQENGAGSIDQFNFREFTGKLTSLYKSI